MANLSFHFKYITDTCVYINRKFQVCIKFVRKVIDRNTHLTCTYQSWISRVTQTISWTAPISYQITLETIDTSWRCILVWFTCFLNIGHCCCVLGTESLDFPHLHQPSLPRGYWGVASIHPLQFLKMFTSILYVN